MTHAMMEDTSLPYHRYSTATLQGSPKK